MRISFDFESQSEFKLAMFDTEQPRQYRRVIVTGVRCLQFKLLVDPCILTELTFRRRHEMNPIIQSAHERCRLVWQRQKHVFYSQN